MIKIKMAQVVKQLPKSLKINASEKRGQPGEYILTKKNYLYFFNVATPSKWMLSIYKWSVVHK